MLCSVGYCEGTQVKGKSLRLCGGQYENEIPCNEKCK